MAFDPITATKNDWRIFFGNDRNMSKGSAGMRDYQSTACLRAFRQIAQGTLSKADRSTIVIQIVEVLLEKWGALAHLEGINAAFRGLRHPIQDIIVLAEINGVPDTDMIEHTLQFWEKLPPEENRSLLLRSFRKYSPVKSTELETLFHEDLEQYGKTVVSILLERGQIDQADALFCSRMPELYSDVDPGCLDWLVKKGLPVATACKWLEQSINRKNADRGDKVAIEYCKEAISRWSKLAPPETAPP